MSRGQSSFKDHLTEVGALTGCGRVSGTLPLLLGVSLYSTLWPVTEGVKVAVPAVSLCYEVLVRVPRRRTAVFIPAPE